MVSLTTRRDGPCVNSADHLKVPVNARFWARGVGGLSAAVVGYRVGHSLLSPGCGAASVVPERKQTPCPRTAWARRNHIPVKVPLCEGPSTRSDRRHPSGLRAYAP